MAHLFRLRNPLRIISLAKSAYLPTSGVGDKEKVPKHANPDVATAHIERLLAQQEVAWDGLDTKIAALFGFSATVLSVLGAFLALRTGTPRPIALGTETLRTGGLDEWMIGLLSFNVALFLVIAFLAFVAWHTRPFKNIRWQDLIHAMRTRPDDTELKWALFLGQARAYDFNDAVITFKAVAVDYLIVLFVAQALSLVAAILYSAV